MTYLGLNLNILAIDFDGTITKEGRFPEIGEPRIEVINAVKNARKQGYKIILWTNRQDDNPICPGCLTDAVNFCKEQGLEFDAINENLSAVITVLGGNPRKITTDYFIDDRSPGSIEWLIDTFGGDVN